MTPIACSGGASADDISGDDGSDTLEGGGGDDTLDGGDEADTLIGGAGADVLAGGDGLDTADYTDSGAAVSVDLGGNVATGGTAEGDTFSAVENVIGTGFQDTLRGDTANNRLVGGAENDTLVGGAGGDTLDGGGGVDTADYLASGFAINVSLLSGAGGAGDASGDVLIEIENIIGSTHDDTITGGTGNNLLEGREGADTIEGGDGADTLDGGADIDTASYENAGGPVFANLGNSVVNTGEAAGDIYTSIENLAGSAFDDTLVGDTAANELYGDGGADSIDGGLGDDRLEGEGGNDTLIGSGGADFILGGAGDDFVDYSGSASRVFIRLGTGTSSLGDAAGDIILQVEAAIGSEFNDTIQASSGDDSLYGRGGEDRLIGGAGADLLDGGGDIDTVDFGGTGGAVIVDLAAGTGAGGQAAGDQYISIENVVGSTGNDNITGSTDNNLIETNLGNDTVSAGDGADTIIGSFGNDSLLGEIGDDSIEGDDGTDFIDGGEGADILNGGEDNDNIVGGMGNDTIDGGADQDVLSGDEGDDVISGGSGSDQIRGGIGADTLSGDAGDGGRERSVRPRIRRGRMRRPGRPPTRPPRGRLGPGPPRGGRSGSRPAGRGRCSATPPSGWWGAPGRRRRPVPRRAGAPRRGPAAPEPLRSGAPAGHRARHREPDSRRRLPTVLDPAVALLLELEGQLLATRAHDAPAGEHVHEVGRDVLEQALVVGDHQHAALGVAQGVGAAGHHAERVDVEPRVRLVEHRELRLEEQHLQHLVALLLAAREALVDGPAHQVLRHLDDGGLLLDQRHEVHGVELLLAPMGAPGVHRRLEEVDVADPGDLDRVLEREEDARRGRAPRARGSSRSLPLSEADRPP